jgi:hypothetical protein
MAKSCDVELREVSKKKGGEVGDFVLGLLAPNEEIVRQSKVEFNYEEPDEEDTEED